MFYDASHGPEMGINAARHVQWWSVLALTRWVTLVGPSVQGNHTKLVTLSPAWLAGHLEDQGAL